MRTVYDRKVVLYKVLLEWVYCTVTAHVLMLVKSVVKYLPLRRFNLQVRVRKSFYSVTGRLEDDDFTLAFIARRD